MANAHGAPPARGAARLAIAALWLTAGATAIAPRSDGPEGRDPRAIRRVMDPVVLDPLPVRPERGKGARSVSATHVDASGAHWVGTRHGSVWWSEGDAWRRLEGGFAAAGYPIEAIATRGEAVYVASRGVWSGTREEALRELPAFAGAPVADVAAHPEHGLAVATRDGVWREADTGWRQMWPLQGPEPPATSLAFSPDGTLWIGTRDGLLGIDRGGRVSRDLAGIHVAALAAGDDGAVHVGTRGSGLFLRYAGAWRRVGEAGGRDVAHIAGLSSAPGGTLWLRLEDGDLLRTGPATSPVAHVSAR